MSVQGIDALLAFYLISNGLLPSADAPQAAAALLLPVFLALRQRWAWRLCLGLIPLYVLGPAIRFGTLPPGKTEGDAYAWAFFLFALAFALFGGAVQLLLLWLGRSAVRERSYGG